MPKTCRCAFLALAAFLALTLPAGAQSVISTRSGVIHYFEGAVYLGDQPLESHLGRFSSVPQGAELRTADGRAEVLLTPGVFLRMGERSAIRMVANDLADTQVQLETGSVLVDSGEPNSGTSVTLVYKDRKVHFLQKGVYRIDSDPPRLWVSQGSAEVFDGTADKPVSVADGMKLSLADELAPERSLGEPADALSEWADGRGESIAADDAITAQIGEDPASQSASDGFTNYPFLGVPALGLVSSGPYGSYTLYQPGFNSIYLPGYAYPPLILGLMGPGLRNSYPSIYGHIGVLPGTGIHVPITVPRAPLAPGVRPAPVRGAPPPHIVVRGVGHR